MDLEKIAILVLAYVVLTSPKKAAPVAKQTDNDTNVVSEVVALATAIVSTFGDDPNAQYSDSDYLFDEA